MLLDIIFLSAATFLAGYTMTRLFRWVFKKRENNPKDPCEGMYYRSKGTGGKGIFE